MTTVILGNTNHLPFTHIRLLCYIEICWQTYHIANLGSDTICQGQSGLNKPSRASLLTIANSLKQGFLKFIYKLLASPPNKAVGEEARDRLVPVAGQLGKMHLPTQQPKVLFLISGRHKRDPPCFCQGFTFLLMLHLISSSQSLEILDHIRYTISSFLSVLMKVRNVNECPMKSLIQTFIDSLQ